MIAEELHEVLEFRNFRVQRVLYIVFAGRKYEGEEIEKMYKRLR